jgi:hypothetical protein
VKVRVGHLDAGYRRNIVVSDETRNLGVGQRSRSVNSSIVIEGVEEGENKFPYNGEILRVRFSVNLASI